MKLIQDQSRYIFSPTKEITRKESMKEISNLSNKNNRTKVHLDIKVLTIETSIKQL